MGDATDEGVFKHMRERTVPDVVHQDGCLNGFCLRVENEDAFLLKRENGLAHQVESPQGMLEARMARPRIDHRRKAYLVDTIKALHQRMADYLVEYSPGYLDESEYRIVDDGVMVQR